MTSTRRCALTLLVACALLGGACGIDPDDEPRSIPDGALPEALLAPATTTTIPETVGTVDRTLYFARSDADVLASLQVPVPSDEVNPIGATLRALVAVTAPSGDELTQAIPPGTEVLAAELDTASGMLTINLSASMEEIEGSRQVQAFAQLVYTATEFPTVTGGIRFLIDGKASSTPTADGTRPANETVDRDDYRRFDPSLPPTTRPPPPTTSTTSTTAPKAAADAPRTSRSDPPSTEDPEG